jgi:hypothetical protein
VYLQPDSIAALVDPEIDKVYAARPRSSRYAARLLIERPSSVLRRSNAWKVLKGMVMVIRLGARLACESGAPFTLFAETIEGLSDELLYFLFRFARQGGRQHKSSCVGVLMLMSGTDGGKSASAQMEAL